MLHFLDSKRLLREPRLAFANSFLGGQATTPQEFSVLALGALHFQPALCWGLLLVSSSWCQMALNSEDMHTGFPQPGKPVCPQQNFPEG